MDEHHAKYDAFTKLMLSLSVGFITIAIGLKSGDIDIATYKKIAILFHSFSILCGIWLQYLLMVKPIQDLNTIAKKWSNSEEVKNGNGAWFSRNPTKIQGLCFQVQMFAFLAAFTSIVVGVLI